MLLNQNCLQLKPKVAILDDDPEIITDLKLCLEGQIRVEGFSTYNELAQQIHRSYRDFLKALARIFFEIKRKPHASEDLQSAFVNLAKNAPYTVALVDLNLQNQHDLEGFELSEKIEKLAAKSMIYSGHHCEELAMGLMNQGIISGVLNKACDLYEDLVPAIYSLNRQFYYEHFNLTHLMALDPSQSMDWMNGIEALKALSSKEEFLVFDESFHFLQLDSALEEKV